MSGSLSCGGGGGECKRCQEEGWVASYLTLSSLCDSREAIIRMRDPDRDEWEGDGRF